MSPPKVLFVCARNIADRRPRQLTPAMVADADLVVVLGREARVDGAGTAVGTWGTDEPSERGVEGIERMRLVRDDIAARVGALADRLGAGRRRGRGRVRSRPRRAPSAQPKRPET